LCNGRRYQLRRRDRIRGPRSKHGTSGSISPRPTTPKASIGSPGWPVDLATGQVLTEKWPWCPGRHGGNAVDLRGWLDYRGNGRSTWR